MKLSDYPNLKAEILALPVKERDKLLLRLVARDKVLTERLHFLLIEGEEALATRVSILKEELASLSKLKPKAGELEASQLLQSIRQGMKVINHFNKVTKSKFETLELKLYFLNLYDLSALKSGFLKSRLKQDLLFKYLIKSTLSIFKATRSLHEDLQYDLVLEAEKWLAHLHKTAPSEIQEGLGLIKIWK